MDEIATHLADLGISVQEDCNAREGFKTYIEEMSLSTTYGDGLMLQMAMKKLKRPIRVIHSNAPQNPPRVLTDEETENKPQIYLAYEQNNHYVSIQPISA